MLSAVTSPPLHSQHEPREPIPDGAAIGAEREGAVRVGARCGIVVAAATAGAITGFSLHAPGGPLAPFATTGRMLLGVSLNEARAEQLFALLGGLALHTLVAVAWSVLFALLAGSVRGLRLWMSAALFAVAAYVASEYLLPSLLRLGHGARPFPSQLALLYAVLAVALVVGMRLANSGAVGTAGGGGSPGT